MDEAFRKLTPSEWPTLETRSRAFHRMAADGVTVEHRADDGAVRAIEATQVIEELIQLAREMREASARGEEHRLDAARAGETDLTHVRLPTGQTKEGDTDGTRTGRGGVRRLGGLLKAFHGFCKRVFICRPLCEDCFSLDFLTVYCVLFNTFST